ncbi:MAG: cytochrome c biogenesis protein CcsA [Planctomycetota bacterium]|nr:cytochrome c biogenesis protein CcsA [Planctomycetota bacterium]
MAAVLLPIALLSYLAGITAAAVAVLGPVPRARFWAPALIGAGTCAHWIEVIRRAVDVGGLPIADVSGYLLVLGGAVSVLYLTVWLRWKVDALALVLTPLAVVTAAIVWRLARSGSTGEAPPEGWLALHVSLATAGMAILGLAFAMALFYILQDFALKARRNLVVLEMLPSLNRCDRLGFQALIVGFLVFSLGIFGGIVLQADLHAAWVPVDSKQALSLVAWTIFAVVVLLRVTAGFRGRRSATLVIVGFIAGLFAVFGMAV